MGSLVLVTDGENPERLAAASAVLASETGSTHVLIYVDGPIGHAPISLATLDWVSRLYVAAGWVNPLLSLVPLLPAVGWSPGEKALMVDGGCRCVLQQKLYYSILDG